MKKIGVTTTVPAEVLIAAGYQPVDLNNLFIISENYAEYIDIAERDGFPKSMCAWIKGIYGACIQNDIKEIIGVTEGDCSNTKALLEVLDLKGVKFYPFAFPHSHDKKEVKEEIEKFMEIFKVSHEEVEKVREDINSLREIAKEIDRMTYEDFKVSGFENHLYQVSFSDLGGGREAFEKQLKEAVEDMKKRNPDKKKVRLGYLGVPPMTGDIYDYVESLDAKIIFNEVQREFAFPRASEAKDIFEQYYDYTYPYDTNYRLNDLKKEIEKRKLDGIIHYTQAFCYRAVEDIVLKQNLDIPILNIEGDKSNALDARTKLRIEAFIDMISDLKEVE